MYACEPAYHAEGCRIEWAAKKKGKGGGGNLIAGVKMEKVFYDGDEKGGHVVGHGR